MNFTYIINQINPVTFDIGVTYTHETLGTFDKTLRLSSPDMPFEYVHQMIQQNAPYATWKLIEEGYELPILAHLDVIKNGTYIAPENEGTFNMPPISPGPYDNVAVVDGGINIFGKKVINWEVTPMNAMEIISKKSYFRNLKIAQIQEKRDQIKIGGVKVGDKWFHTDNDSRIQYLGLVNLGDNVPANLQWKTMDGSFQLMSKTLVNAIFTAVSALDINVFSIAEMHITALKAMEWPERYDFNTTAPAWPQHYVPN